MKYDWSGKLINELTEVKDLILAHFAQRLRTTNHLFGDLKRSSTSLHFHNSWIVEIDLHSINFMILRIWKLFLISIYELHCNMSLVNWIGFTWYIFDQPQLSLIIAWQTCARGEISVPCRNRDLITSSQGFPACIRREKYITWTTLHAWGGKNILSWQHYMHCEENILSWQHCMHR